MYQLRSKYPKSARRLSVAPGVFPGVSPGLPDFFTLEFPIHGCPHLSGHTNDVITMADCGGYKLFIYVSAIL